MEKTRFKSYELEYRGYKIIKCDLYTRRFWTVEGYPAAYISKEVCEKVIDTYLYQQFK